MAPIHIHVSIVSKLKHLLQPVFSPSSILIEVDLTGDIINRSYLSLRFTWSVNVMERAGVPNVLSTQCPSATEGKERA